MTCHVVAPGALLAALVLLGGCAAYLGAGERTRQTEQKTTEEKRGLETEKTRRTELEDRNLQLERENKRVNDRIAATQVELKRQDTLLAAALKDRKVSQARWRELKTELESIKAEAQNLELQAKGDAVGKPDPASQAAKEKRLKDLEERKSKLEATLQQLAKS